MANYLPVLLLSVSTNAIPDDSTLVTLPRGQVDYLSHDWAEEDVWRSWRNMTRQKNEIANGMRLENASWRTWWKQRNKLKTVTPETLNWLKDSDVTWLYGPLHTAVEWTPPPKPKPDPTEVGKLSSAEDRLDLAAKHKPILKHRTISEQLTSDLVVSPVFSPAESEEEDDNTVNSLFHATRPPLLQTKSTPRIPPLPHASLRKPSPPRVPPPSMASSSALPVPKRHITFNTFVEQCIAVDSPRRAPLSHNSSGSSSNSTSSGHNSHANDAPAAWDGRTRGLRWAGDDDESDDDDGSHWAGESALSSDSDDALEVCLPRSRSNSSYSRSSHSSHGSGKPTLTFSTGSKTIAPIAPARLKTTGVGNSWVGGGWVSTRDEGREPEEVHLTRSAATVDLRSSSMHNLSSAFDTEESFDEDAPEDEVFTHSSAYFSAGAAYDYFAGPDLGVEFAPGVAVVREQRGRRGSNSGAEILEIEGASPLRSSHTSPLGSLSPEYGGVRVSADYGTGFPYGYGVGAKRRGANSVSPDDGASVSPEKSSTSSAVSSATTSTEDSNSSSSGATATRPRVEVNGVQAGLREEEEERSLAQTPANSPVVRTRVPVYISAVERSSPGSAKSASTTSSSATPPTSQPSTPTPNKPHSVLPKSSPPSNRSSPPNKSSPPSKPASSTSKSIPVARPGKGALTLEMENAQKEYADDETRRANPTPANSPVVRVRVPPRIPGPGANGKAKPAKAPSPAANSNSKPASSSKPPIIAPGPASPSRATFQTGASAATAERAAPGPNPSGGSASALQRTLVLPPGEGDATIVGKAVGMVSTAGAYFGLWSGA
ncbi:hypothetical protein B0H17DRAFT_400711 [Mycena rosella]|uniref:Nitrogen regulatory protein areA GATA-like domain-containing protein n=1 Tax=Mycena rosella TaxID=1033263 RepID=A0AAD7DRK9_MYCRO|nr:hypothetical protein B0H17DRAFT_400711 [Mycena rosella]